MIQNEKLFRFLLTEFEQPFSGWDFSYVTNTGRMQSAPLTWNYTAKLLQHLRQTDSLLDMGTGGGEYLANIAPLPRHTCATEAYAPNVLIARERLAPLGANVFAITEDDSLPFDDEEFQLIINRHESYSASELYRILEPQGRFITQQVGGRDTQGLNDLFAPDTEREFPHWNLEYAVQELRDAGFTILEAREDRPITRFFDVGAIAYYLKAIPWQIPDFSIEKHFNALIEVHNHIQKHGYIDFHQERFFIQAQKAQK